MTFSLSPCLTTVTNLVCRISMLHGYQVTSVSEEKLGVPVRRASPDSLDRGELLSGAIPVPRAPPAFPVSMVPTV